MNQTIKFFALVLYTASMLIGLCSAAEATADFYVSPNGSDAWSGTLSEPNAQQPTGRSRRLSRPVFSSGRQIKDWKPVTDALPGLPKQTMGKVQVADVSGRFRTLFDADGLLPRARSQGFIPLNGGSRNELHFPAGRLKNWPNVEDVEIVVRPHHAWIVNVLPLQSVDEQKQMARTSIDATYAVNSLHFLKTTESCWVENTLEELDEPGEWVLNTQEGKLYLWPQ